METPLIKKVPIIDIMNILNELYHNSGVDYVDLTVVKSENGGDTLRFIWFKEYINEAYQGNPPQNNKIDFENDINEII